MNPGLVGINNPYESDSIVMSFSSALTVPSVGKKVSGSLSSRHEENNVQQSNIPIICCKQFRRFMAVAFIIRFYNG